MSNSKKGPGIISTLLGLIFIWALLFGVTCGQSHYLIKCTPEEGVFLKVNNIKEK